MLKAELETVKAEKAALEKELSELKVGYDARTLYSYRYIHRV